MAVLRRFKVRRENEWHPLDEHNATIVSRMAFSQLARERTG
jgi:hypothetical protein